MSTTAFGIVHGDKIDGHFFSTAMNYMQHQSAEEWRRLNMALLEAADHIEDPGLAEKYRAEAANRMFQDTVVAIRSGPLLSMGRGALCANFLDHTECDWLFMSDSDMTWDPHVPAEMVRLAESQEAKRGSRAGATDHRPRPGGIQEHVPAIGENPGAAGVARVVRR